MLQLTYSLCVSTDSPRLDSHVLLTNPIGSNDPHEQETKGKIQNAQGQIHTNGRPPIFARKLLQPLTERKRFLGSTVC